MKTYKVTYMENDIYNIVTVVISMITFLRGGISFQSLFICKQILKELPRNRHFVWQEISTEFIQVTSKLTSDTIMSNLLVSDAILSVPVVVVT